MAVNFLGRDFTGITDYWPSNQYPVFALDKERIEGACKRYVPFPTTSTLRAIALFGLKRLSPEGYAEITDEYLEHHLTSTISELEMKHNIVITPTEFNQPFDYVEGMFTSNYMGLNLLHWPATAVLAVNLKFPHAQSSKPIQAYELPPQWVCLTGNHVNVLADFGTIAITSRGYDADGGGMVGSMVSFLSGTYRPSSIEVVYRAGFYEDRFPAVLADWIITCASIRILSDISPILFPFSGTSTTIDGVSQSTSLPGPRFLLNRIDALIKKEAEQRSAIKGAFGQNITRTFIGV